MIHILLHTLTNVHPTGYRILSCITLSYSVDHDKRRSVCNSIGPYLVTAIALINSHSLRIHYGCMVHRVFFSTIFILGVIRQYITDREIKQLDPRAIMSKQLEDITQVN